MVMIIGRIIQDALSAGLEEVMEFLEQSFPNVDIAIAHGKVIFPYILNYVNYTLILSPCTTN